MDLGREDNDLSEDRTEWLESAQAYTTDSNDPTLPSSLLVGTPITNAAADLLHRNHSLNQKLTETTGAGNAKVHNRVSSGHSRRSSEALHLPDSLRRKSSSQRHDTDSHSSPSNPSFRRYPSTTNSPAGGKFIPAAMPLLVAENTISTTPASVAAEHFKKDLAQHTAWDTYQSDTTVVIHDSCYGHRYSRPKTSKATLNLIVERPERLQAAMLGISSAYVRLGGRHIGARASPRPLREPSCNIPFHIKKSTRSVPLTSSVVTNIHGVKWMQELKSMCDSAEAKLAARGKELSRVELPIALTPALSRADLHEGDLYLCKESLDAFQGALGGVLDGVDAVFQGSLAGTGNKKAFVCIRPPGHHCSSDYPSGFCWLNNVHIGIEHAAQTHGLTHAAIIDFDLHHGDGSQAITWERNSKVSKMPKNTPITRKTSVGYFSIHDVNSYPCEYGDTEKIRNASVCIDNAHGQSIWNVHLQPWKEVSEFWELYTSRYLVLLDQARAFLRNHTKRMRSSAGTVKPKAAIFLSAGFDASEWESEGMQRHKVNVPTEFYRRFTADIVKLAEEEETGVDGRIISVLEGGYSNRALTSGILSHLTGLVGAHESDMPSSWWTSSTLAELENLTSPDMPSAAPKKTRHPELPTYTSTTQSFTAKMVDPLKNQISVSGTLLTPPKTRPPTPPSPDVDWATAAHEMSKLLIPTDRQIESCKHEELSEPRFKRERHSSIGLPLVDPTGEGMKLRGRKTKVASYADPEVALEIRSKRAVSNSNRRRTIANMPVIIDEASPEPVNIIPPIARNEQEQRLLANVTAKSSNMETNQIYPAPKARQSNAKRDGEAIMIKVSKTRRASGVKADLEATNLSKVPPVPRLPPSYRDSAIDDEQSPVALTAKTDIDGLISGIKSITLKTSQDRKGKMPSTGPNPANRPVQKHLASRNPKGVATKPRATRTAEATRVAASAIDRSLPVIEGSPINLHHPNGIILAMPTESEAVNHVAKPLTMSDAMQGLEPVVEATPDFEISATALHTLNDLDPPNMYGTPSQSTLESQANSSSHDAMESGAGSTPTDSSDANDTNVSSAESVPYVHTGLSDPVSKHNLIKLEPETRWSSNTSTPATKLVMRDRVDLPIFSAEGFIPFAAKHSDSIDGGADVVIQTARVKGEEAAVKRIEEMTKAIGERNADMLDGPEPPGVDDMLLD